jgi:hypothetical protein
LEEVYLTNPNLINPKYLNLSGLPLTSCIFENIIIPFSLNSCNLSDSALNELFTYIGTLEEGVTAEIRIAGNPGAATCDVSIAEAKGWTVIR